jgi:class 3 adenylate cyclase/tetratricopeptide (TPR) repeat protein
VSAAREQRKTVSIVFCDVTGSTELGESTDPEALRALLARYFERMKGIVEAHGGSVEKFIGDAVMAVFGVPLAHEDDALRACRAAVEMRDALPELGIAGRIGVNTGEVVTGTEERLATGDAVNVAARLEQAARPGEVLIGQGTLRLVRAAVEVDEEQRLELKGKAEPVGAFRLLAVTGELERRFVSPMVGREHEIARLRAVFGQALHDRSCQLFTLLGSAGVGKSRLAAEFLAGLDSRVVRGRCLSYGEGITYWPVVEILKHLGTLPEGDAARPLRSLLGRAEDAASAEEIAWGFRKLLEQEALERPLVAVFDDLHWGEETLLDLVEHIADLSRDAPILVLCMARPELLERRPSWGGGKWNATTVLLEPLDASETEQLLSSLGEVPPELHERIVQVAEGNPLFLEEMLGLLRDSGGAKVEVPPTIQALLAARLDQLDPAERLVLEHGSVEGRTFHRGAVAALANGEGSVDQRLVALVRKELVRPDRPQLPGDDAYRFRHLLIRDAAYDALPKSARADLHARFADWLETRAGDLVESDEIVGYHLEQAYRYRAELGLAGDETEALAYRAAERLTIGGRTALGRYDVAAAASLLGRAVDLLPASDAARSGLLTDLARALFDRGETAAAAARSAEARLAAEERGDEGALARAELQALAIQAQADPAAMVSTVAARIEAMISRLEELGEHEALADAWGILGRFQFFVGQAAASEASYDRSLEYARLSGNRRQEQETTRWLMGAKRYGPTPVTEVLAFLEECGNLADGDAGTDVWRGALTSACLAMQGRFDEARSRLEASRRKAAELGMEVRRLGSAMEAGPIELLAGNVQAAVEQLREGYDGLGRLGETGFRSTVGTLLAEALERLGRDEEAEAVLRECEAIAQGDDFDPQARMRFVRARLLARQGDFAEAERLAREAVAIMDSTDYLDNIAHAYVALADVLAVTGRSGDAAQALTHAATLFERKGDLVSAARAHEQIAALQAEA